MKKKKPLIWVALVASLLLVTTGCSQNQQEIFNANLKMQDVNSMKAHTTMTFKLSGSGLEPTAQQQFDTASTFLNNAKLDLDVLTNGNPQKTTSQSQVAINLVTPGMTINLPCWVDSDLTGNTPNVKEIVKLPQIAKASLPTQIASKEYMVLNTSDMNKSVPNTMDMTSLMEFSKDFQAKEVAFLTSYAQRFNPNLDTADNGIQYVQTDEGLVPARAYEVKLNDAQFKYFIRYTVNNFVQDSEAMNFVKDFMDSILGFSQVPDKAKTSSDFDQAFKEFDTNKAQFLTQFNTAMDQLNNVPLLGDKGIDLQYDISRGYLIKKSGTIDLKVDLAQINQFVNTLSGQQSPIEAKGLLNLMINYNTDVSGINTPQKIEIPEITADNSFNYMDLIKLSTTATGTGTATGIPALTAIPK